MTDRFQILSTLGSGGRGTLYRAWDKARNCDVALKRPNAEGAAREELQRESRRLYALRHPNVVKVLEFGEDDEGPWLVMEMIKGESLEARLAKGPLGLADFRALVEQSLAGLGAAHEAGLLHLDIKAENLMLPWDAHDVLRVKLVDFGLAREPGAGPESPSGSVHSMAPEHFNGGALDERTDLYSLGVVFYQALTGRLPFEGETKPEVITAHLRHEMTPLAELRPDLSAALCAWVERLLSVDPRERPASTEEAWRQFRGIPLEERAVSAEEVVETVLAAEEDEEAPVLAAVEEDEEPVVAAPASEPEPAALEIVAPERPAAAPEITAPLMTAVPVAEAEPVRAARPAPAARAPRRRRSLLGVIVGAFAVILLGQFALVSWFQHSRKGEREARFAELAAQEQPEGSDLDVRLLLTFLDDGATQDEAAAVLARLRGGAYIDEMLRGHLRKIRSYPAAGRLIEVMGQRRDKGAFEDVLAFLDDNRAGIREAAWGALGGITPEARLPEVLRRVSKTVTREHPLVEKFLAGILARAEDPEAVTAAVIAAYRAEPADSAHRALLFNAIARHGGAGTLDIITEAIADPSERVRRSAITLLAEYPTHDALPAIAARLPQETDDTCRTYLLIAAIELVERPGPLSQQALYQNAQALYGEARDGAERRYVLSMLSRVISPDTAGFFERFAAQAEPPLRREARQLAQAFREKLESVIRLADTGLTGLPASQAAYRLGSALIHRDGALVDWNSPADWASWLVEVPAAGKYEVRIHQSHAGEETGTYEVLLAGTVLPAAVVATGGESKGFILGEIEVPEPGIYKIFLRPRKLPAQGGLFEVQKLALQLAP